MGVAGRGISNGRAMCSRAAPQTSPPSLLTLSSVVVAASYPFTLIEDRYRNIIPEPVQKSVIYHSFPKREADVLVYASPEFNPDRYSVHNVVQIGFYISGIVTELQTRKPPSRSAPRRPSTHDEDDPPPPSSYNVSATFDRCKITSVSCNCEHDNWQWCDHSVSLALHRIRKCDQETDFTLRVPISETLLQLSKLQLQKLIQYLISDHTDVLPSAQRLADEILRKHDDNYINSVHGAPDFTVPWPTEHHAWALDTNVIQSQVRAYVSQQQTTPNVISTLIDKAYRMIKSRDSNATRIVEIITNELTRHVSRSPPRPQIPTPLWDSLVQIWNVLALKPEMSSTESQSLVNTLTALSCNEHLPSNEDPSDSEDDDQDSPTKRPKLARSIFSYPLKLLKKQVNPHDYDCSLLHSRVCHGNSDNEFALRIVQNLKITKSPTLRIENAHVLFDVLQRTHPRASYEAALIGLTCHSNLRPISSYHEKHMKHVEKLVQKIQPLGQANSDLLKYYATLLLGSNANPKSFPPISFVTYAFNNLGSPLAYKLALKYLNLSEYAFVHSHLESQQIALATHLLTSSKDNEQSLEEISSTIKRVVKSNTNVFRLAQEVFKHASNEKLVNVAFNLALHVVKATKYTVHRRRWEMVRWVVSCGVEIGVAKLFYLVRNWGEFFSPVEAVGTVASNILAWVGGGTSPVCPGNACPAGGVAPPGGQASIPVQCGGGKLSSAIVDKRVLEELGNAARNLAIQCAKNDPSNCCLNALTLCETDVMAFERSYQIVLESASKEFLTPQQIFTIARYMEHRGYTQRAYRLAVQALTHVHVNYNQDTHSLISEIHWTVTLAHQLSTPLPSHPPPQSRPRYPLPPPPPPPNTRFYAHRLIPHSSSQPPPQLPPLATSELDNLIPLLIRNVKCASVLTSILTSVAKKQYAYENAYQKTSERSVSKLKSRVYEKLSLLIEGTIDSYVTTIHSRLVNISPRHYSDFIEFLRKARDVFLLNPKNGSERFASLVHSIGQMRQLKGKKKLLLLLNEFNLKTKATS